jgi:hypothetical protein
MLNCWCVGVCRPGPFSATLFRTPLPESPTRTVHDLRWKRLWTRSEWPPRSILARGRRKTGGVQDVCPPHGRVKTASRRQAVNVAKPLRLGVVGRGCFLVAAPPLRPPRQSHGMEVHDPRRLLHRAGFRVAAAVPLFALPTSNSPPPCPERTEIEQCCPQSSVPSSQRATCRPGGCHQACYSSCAKRMLP